MIPRYQALIPSPGGHGTGRRHVQPSAAYRGCGPLPGRERRRDVQETRDRPRSGGRAPHLGGGVGGGGRLLLPGVLPLLLAPGDAPAAEPPSAGARPSLAPHSGGGSTTCWSASPTATAPPSTRLRGALAAGPPLRLPPARRAGRRRGRRAAGADQALRARRRLRPRARRGGLGARHRGLGVPDGAAAGGAPARGAARRRARGARRPFRRGGDRRARPAGGGERAARPLRPAEAEAILAAAAGRRPAAGGAAFRKRLERARRRLREAWRVKHGTK